MSLILIVLIMLLLFGGGGYYYGGPRIVRGIGGLLLITIYSLAIIRKPPLSCPRGLDAFAVRRISVLATSSSTPILDICHVF
jgi:hypothetical protein